ncbi:MAG: hypothetical protein IT282_07740 [Bacteroidetes bacterium]|nr:hypothetical protein [Bacteroidota bacterium]
MESFEVFNGYGIMANTYDEYDLLANAVGVGCALALDVALLASRSENKETGPA